MSEPLASVAGLVKAFDGRPVLDHVDVELHAGEALGLCGPSGSGKSTLLHILVGTVRPDAGTVTVCGSGGWRRGLGGRWRHVAPPPRAVLPVAQDPVASLDARWAVWRSVTEGMAAGPLGTVAGPLGDAGGGGRGGWFPRGRQGGRAGRAVRRRVAAEALASLGLGQVDIDARPVELSVGQCQRVALARAVVARPRLLLADEPTSALDATSAAGVLGVLRRFVDEGAGLLVVSHDVAALRSLCDRVVELRAGRLVEPAEPGAPARQGALVQQAGPPGQDEPAEGER